MTNNNTPRKNSPAFFAQAAIAFGTALFTTLIAIYYLPADPWIKAFLLISNLFLVSSAFTLAKCVRDQQEDTYIATRLDQARVDKLIAEHDPFRQQAS